MAKTFQVDTGGTLTTGIIGYWKMEDATEFLEGYPVANTDVSFIAGKVNNCGDFNGTTAKFVMSNQTPYNVTSNFSWSFWMNGDAFTGGPVLLSKFNASNQSFYFQFDSANNFRFATSSNGTTQSNGDIPWTPSTSTWYHVVATYTASSNTVQLFVNTASQGTSSTATISIFAGTSAIDFGQYNGGGGNFFDGKLDEIGFWNKVLSTVEISDLYNGGSGQTMIDSEGSTKSPSGGAAYGSPMMY